MTAARFLDSIIFPITVTLYNLLAAPSPKCERADVIYVGEMDKDEKPRSVKGVDIGGEKKQLNFGGRHKLEVTMHVGSTDYDFGQNLIRSPCSIDSVHQYP